MKHKISIKRKGFTLLEILLVIAAIGILAAIVLVAINPNRQIAQVRNAERRSEVNTLYKALEQYLIEKQGYPAGITETEQNICINDNTAGCVNLGVLVPDYVANIPVDPSGISYKIGIVDGRVRVRASEAELGVNIAISGSGGTVAGGTAQGDPYWSNVSLLLNFDGTNGSTTFTDSSSSSRTVTRSGNTQISTAQSKFGNSSALFDGNGDSLSVGASVAFDVGAGSAFTIECFVRRNVNGIGGTIFSQRTSWYQPFEIFFNGTGNMRWLISNAAVNDWAYNETTTSSNIISSQTWHHVALVGTGTNLVLYVDGVARMSNIQPLWISTARSLYIGLGGGEAFNGHIDDFRFTKGVARYTANFTPPTEPFPTQ